jgi:hypothetical protein
MSNQVLVPQVTKDETKKFSQVWTYGSVAVPIDDVALQFATDWANQLFRQFILSVAQTQIDQAQMATELPPSSETTETPTIVEA